MLLVGLVGHVGNGFSSARALYPLHLGSMVGGEGAVVDLTEALKTKRTNDKTKDKVWNQSLYAEYLVGSGTKWSDQCRSTLSKRS